MGTMAQARTRWAFGTRAVMGALALALLITVGTVSGVGAERVPSNGDSHQRACRAIQDRGRQLLEEYKELAYASNGTDSRLDTILAEMRNLGQMWRDIGCQDRYGSIIYLEVLPGEEWHVDPIVADPVLGVSDPVLTESPAWHVPTGGILELTEDVSFTESASTMTESEPTLAVAEPSTAAEDEPTSDVVAEPTDSVVVPVEEAATEPVVETATDATVPVDEAIAVDTAAPVTEAVEGQE